jgi:hypothetical protein
MVQSFFFKSKDKIIYTPLILVILLIFSPFFSISQILNLEKYRADGDSLKKYAVNFNGSFNINNRSAAENNPVNLYGYNFSLHGIYTPKKHGYIFIAHRNFLQINDNPFINFGYVHTRINFYRKNRLNFETFAQISDDNFRGLKPRAIAGGALRYRIIENDSSELILGIGGFYEFERWQHPISGENHDVNFIKSTTHIVFRRSLTKNVFVNGVFYYQTGYDRAFEKFRNRYSGTINLNSRITERLSFTNNFDFSYEDRPIVPITRFIFSYRFGIGLDF